MVVLSSDKSWNPSINWFQRHGSPNSLNVCRPFFSQNVQGPDDDMIYQKYFLEPFPYQGAAISLRVQLTGRHPICMPLPSSERDVTTYTRPTTTDAAHSSRKSKACACHVVLQACVCWIASGEAQQGEGRAENANPS
jgi:hypothetical protein